MILKSFWVKMQLEILLAFTKLQRVKLLLKTNKTLSELTYRPTFYMMIIFKLQFGTNWSGH